MTNIRAIDMLLLDDLFEMGSGSVLDLSDKTFAQVFAEELNLDIDDPADAANGGSKGKRRRDVIQTGDKPTVVRTLNGLRDYRAALRRRSGKPDRIESAHGQLLAPIKRLEGRSASASSAGTVPSPKGRGRRDRSSNHGIDKENCSARFRPFPAGNRRQSACPAWD